MIQQKATAFCGYRKKSILILISHYLPGNKIGGPLTSIINIIDHLGSKYDFNIITYNNDLGISKPYEGVPVNSWIKDGNVQIMYLPSHLQSIKSVVREIINVNPDFLYLPSLFSPLFSILIIILHKIKIFNVKCIIVATKGELYDEALNFKKNKKRLFLFFAKRFNLYKEIIFHASTEFEKQSIMKHIKTTSSKVRIATNLSSKTSKEFEICSSSDIMRNYDVINIVFLSRISKDKNLPFVFDVLKKVKRKLILRIYGPIEDNYIWDICVKKSKKLPSNIEYMYLGEVKREKVKNILLNNDLLFLPTFAENFGHVIAESLSVGTPVLISDNTPWKNLSEFGLGWDINLNNMQEFVDVIESKLVQNNIYDQKEARRIRIKAFNALNDTEKIFIDHLKLFSKPNIG
ncbi:Glycosyltransferase involved in cell wall bisynthesis [Desulfocicer vacuolatum DSM 3385]|uniref:Glycosyltransferase involved in cell wall bisynthesis n=1 Tax=Desulfocicer vacuolatum DSM 3385 TaxID=1121400 RepID=A0A1W1Z4Q7_9BACT|nr:glycosyltransferase family 4 protein [Desulfocicer vacuolatum]SMC43419.1 Glycosyltransferase involved in cell wall bisynthesis [Desulfocicer vacuolatum DSM 3385]